MEFKVDVAYKFASEYHRRKFIEMTEANVVGVNGKIAELIDSMNGEFVVTKVDEVGCAIEIQNPLNGERYNRSSVQESGMKGWPLIYEEDESECFTEARGLVAQNVTLVETQNESETTPSYGVLVPYGSGYIIFGDRKDRTLSDAEHVAKLYVENQNGEEAIVFKAISKFKEEKVTQIVKSSF